MKTRWVAARVILFAVAITSSARAAVEFTLPESALTSKPVAVCVAGSFNDWSTTATPMTLQGTTWRASAEILDGRYYYKFVWRNGSGQTHWLLDPGHPYLADNGMCGANSVIDVVSGLRRNPAEGMEYFRFQREGMKWVAVAGDFNNWYLGQFPLYRHMDGIWEVWHVWIELKRPFSYKFIYDGWWIYDTGRERWPRVPDGFGGLNSFRPADSITSPEAVTLSETVRAGDAALLQRVQEYNKQADYGRAVKLARAVAEANEKVSGTSNPLRLRALDLEARLHKRWQRYGEALRCWERLSAVDLDTTETRAAIQELAAYYTHIKRDFEAVRRLCARPIIRTAMSADLVRIVIRHVEATYEERRYDEVVVEADLWLSVLPPPEGASKDYACQLSELWLYKAYAHNKLRQWDSAREACRRLIEMHPYEDSQNVLRAKDILRVIGELEQMGRL